MAYMKAEYPRKDTSDAERALLTQNAQLRAAVSKLVKMKELHPSMKKTVENYKDINKAIKKYNNHADKANKLATCRTAFNEYFTFHPLFLLTYPYLITTI